MLVTLFGIVIEVRPEHQRKAEEPMLVTEPSDGMTEFLQPTIKVLLTVFIRQLPALW